MGQLDRFEYKYYNHFSDFHWETSAMADTDAEEDCDPIDREIAASKPMSPERLRLVFYSFRKELLVLSGLAGLFALAKLLDKLFS